MSDLSSIWRDFFEKIYKFAKFDFFLQVSEIAKNIINRKVRKHSWIYVDILAKQCRSPFDLPSFFNSFICYFRSIHITPIGNILEKVAFQVFINVLGIIQVTFCIICVAILSLHSQILTPDLDFRHSLLNHYK